MTNITDTQLHQTRRPVGSLLSFAFLFTALLFVSSKSIATDIIVTNTNNSGTGSLRDAILQGNASSDGTINITFQTGLTGTISLATSLPMISNYARDGNAFNKTWNITGSARLNGTPGIIIDGSQFSSLAIKNSALFLSPIPVIPTSGTPTNDIDSTYPYTLTVNLANLTIQGNTTKGGNGSTSISTTSGIGGGGGWYGWQRS